MTRAGVEAAPSYDFICILAYANIDHELAMGFGDAFDIDEVKAFALADFAKRIRLPKTLVSRELDRMSRAILDALPAAGSSDYEGAELGLVARIGEICQRRAQRSIAIASEVAKVRSDLIQTRERRRTSQPWTSNLNQCQLPFKSVSPSK